MKVQIDQEKCIGAGQCVLSAPKVFDQRDEDGVVELLDAAPSAGLEAGTRDAAALCPAAAITLDES